MDLREVPDQPFVRHPWEVSRFRFYFGVLKRSGVAQAARSVLDAGAGDGWFAGEYKKRVSPNVRVACWDPGYAGAPMASDGSGPYFVRDRPAEKFDLLLLLDVLEHAEDDSELLQALTGDNLGSGATALISVPAWPFLYGPHDVALSHHRRYRPQELAALGERAGLEVICQGGVFHSLMLPRLVSNFVHRMAHNGEKALQENLTWTGPRWLGRAVAGALRVDNLFSHWAAAARVKMPGLSTWMLCRKP